MKIATRLIALAGLLATFSLAHAQCIPDSLIMGPPGVYPDTLDPIPGCQYSETDITFKLPRDTTAIVFGQPYTVPFNFFRIDSIKGLPAGMTWACNSAPDCVYDVSPSNPDPDTFGCVRITGTPNVPGAYAIIVYLTANVTLLGNSTDQQAIYTKTLNVGGCTISSDCYTYTLDAVCPPAILTMTNGLDSAALANADVSWTVIGSNGYAFQSVQQQPAPLALLEPAEYILNFDAVVDTFPYQLDSMVIQTVNCSDLVDAPDLYWKFTAPGGTVLLNTTGSPVSNATLPLTIPTGKLDLENGFYMLEVWDEDAVGGNDGCAGGPAGLSFQSPPANIGANTVIVNGLTVTFYVSKPVTQVACADTFTVYPLPQEPVLSADTTLFCAGDTAILRAVVGDSIVWYRDFEVIPDEQGDSLVVKESGFYQVESINPASFCRSMSGWIYMEALTVAVPGFVYDGNGAFSISGANPLLVYEWYNDAGELKSTGTSFKPANSGIYYAVAKDPATGCTSAPTKELSVILSSLAHMYDEGSVEIFPNPSDGAVTIAVTLDRIQPFSVEVYDLMGRMIRKSGQQPADTWTADWNVSDWPAGIYLVTVRTEDGVLTERMEKR